MKLLSESEREHLLFSLKTRFEGNTHRHKGISWDRVEEKLHKNPEKLWSLYQMEQTEGEPDVILYDASRDAFCFCDCSKESPKGRRSLCYDLEAWKSRKQNKPSSSAWEEADKMGVALLSEEEYNFLQTLEIVDTKTSSWLKTPKEMRQLGGALFGDYRFGRVFFYHNGADSYYSARGFRAVLWV